MWDDSVNVPWETFAAFFGIFGLKWDPISFLKRGHFRREEAFLVNEYLSRCFYLDHGNLQELALDLGRLDFHRIKYDEIFLRLPQHQHEAISLGARESSAFPGARGPRPPEAQRYNRQLFEKYIRNDLGQ